MFHKVLASDVEFAQGLLTAGCSDAQILRGLALRGIEPTKATELLEDLHHDLKPRVETGFALGIKASPAADAPPQSGRAAGQVAAPFPRWQHQGRRARRKPLPWWFILLAIIFILALGYTVFELVT